MTAVATQDEELTLGTIETLYGLAPVLYLATQATRTPRTRGGPR